MNRLLSVLSVMAVCLVLSAGGVLAEGNQAEFGLRVGGGFSNFEGGPFNSQSKAALNFGVYASANLWGPIEYQAEFNYARKGAETEVDLFAYPDSFVTVIGEVSYDYVEVPLLLKVSPRLSEAVLKPVFLFGGYAAYSLHSTFSIDEAYADRLLDDDYDYGLVFGIGFKTNGTDRQFMLELRYSRGLRAVVERQSGGELKNEALMVSLAVAL